MVLNRDILYDSMKIAKFIKFIKLIGLIVYKNGVQKSGTKQRKIRTAVNFEPKNQDCPSKSRTVGEYDIWIT